MLFMICLALAALTAAVAGGLQFAVMAAAQQDF